MSVINKNPKLKVLLGKMSSEEQGSLVTLINGQGAAAIFRSLKPIAPAADQLTAADKGVKRIKLELAEPVGGVAVWEGYLIYNDEVCAMISYAAEEAQQLFLLEIDVAARKAQVSVAEHTSILELRSELDDSGDIPEVAAALAAMGLNVDALGKITEDEDGNINVPRIVHWDDFSEQYPLMRDMYKFVHSGNILEKGGTYYFIASISDDTLAAFELADDGFTYYFWGEWSSGDEWIDVNWIEDDYALAKNVGTKLYKHTIATQGAQIVIVDATKTAIVSSQITQRFTHSLSAVGVKNGGQFKLISIFTIFNQQTFASTPYMVNVTYDAEGTQTNHVIELDFSTFTDTVTEL